ncbi:MAG: hypothetical protein RQ801_12105 [Spirochaetaceae bacterium]|nr:hypothetical protein [Spirochaetaceae bacterium]MDT8299041.1 hypothetical protein [Spirochaetaceae bacterium]
MTPVRIISALLLIIRFALPVSASDELWSRAINYADPIRADKAATILMETYKRDNVSAETTGMVMVFAWKEQLGDYELVSAVENGKDVTKHEQRRLERVDERDGPSFAHQIFNPDKAAGLTLIPRATTAVVDGYECRIYDFVFKDEWPMGAGKPKPVTEEGTVFIDVENGMPLRLVSRLTEGPDLIVSYEYRMSAASGSDGSWRLKELSMDFVGRMLITRAGGFRMRFNYGEGSS